MLLRDNRTHKIALLGMLAAVAMVLSWLEAQIPVFAAVPGARLGLTNLAVLVALYRLGAKEAVLLNGVRIVLVGVTFGNLSAMLYSLAGGLCSGLIMILLKKTDKFGVITVSVAGGIFHNVGQIIVAMLVLETRAVVYYLPVLWFCGIAAGACVGILCTVVMKRLPGADLS